MLKQSTYASRALLCPVADVTPSRRGLAHRAFVVVLCLLGQAPIVDDTSAATVAPKIIAVGPEEPIEIRIATNLLPSPFFELPPVQVEGAPDLVFASTGWSWLCRLPDAERRASFVLNAPACHRFSVPARLAYASGASLSPKEAASRPNDWSRSYNGVFAAMKLAHDWHGRDLFTLAHGENKNERLGEALYANTVNPAVNPTDCASGYQGGHYKECWASYNGFINLLLADTSQPQTEPIDLGPVIWPSMGYQQNGEKSSGGVRHPSIIPLRDQLYIFYLDSSTGTEPGRQGGLRVARMKLPTGNDPTPAAVPWFEEAFAEDNKSLPSGFTKEQIRSFFEKHGGKASELWPNSWQTARFVVARIKGTSLFLGAEEYVSGQSWGIRLRTSSDLVHWSMPVGLPGLETQSGWANGMLHYPTFSDSLGQYTGIVDPVDFYLVGTKNGGHVVRRRIHLAPP